LASKPKPFKGIGFMARAHAGEAALLEVCIAQVEQQFPNAPQDIRATLITIASNYLQQKATYAQASSSFVSIVGFSEPIERLREILEISDDPLPPADVEEESTTSTRRKMKMWSLYEDNRLLAGIYRYGVNNWAPISRFVGNSRTRAQCAQRWARGLNPRICKESWDPCEDVRLVQLVRTFGDKAWTKIASQMGNRSDVQCRYHYMQLVKEMPHLMEPFAFPSMGVGPAPAMPVKPVFSAQRTPRFSQPLLPRLVPPTEVECAPMTPPARSQDEQPAPRRRASHVVTLVRPSRPWFDEPDPPEGVTAPPLQAVPEIALISHLLNPAHD
jgi:hypothetical protein